MSLPGVCCAPLMGDESTEVTAELSVDESSGECSLLRRAASADSACSSGIGAEAASVHLRGGRACAAACAMRRGAAHR